MRYFNDPVTAMAVVAGVAAVAGGTAGLARQEEQGEQQNRLAHRQAKLVELEAGRQVRDEQTEQELRTQRILAVAAQRGGGLLGALTQDIGESNLRVNRIRANALSEAKGLRFQGRSAKAASTPTIFDGLGVLSGGLMAGISAGGATKSLLTPTTTIAATTPTTAASRVNRFGRLSGPV